MPSYALWRWDALDFMKKLPQEERIDLVVTSPPYNLGKEYENRAALDDYLAWQKDIIDALAPLVKKNGSVCWQVGNFVENGYIEPLDIALHPLFREAGLQLRNRIVWRFGHGLHCRKRFSGRYETVLWYTKGNDYTFNLDAVRIQAKYPGKRHYKGPNVGKLSGNPDGKNPEDVWDIPNVKARHIEKTSHPCQFPVGLAERLVLALSMQGEVVFDPFCGVGSAGVAAALHGRRFWGCDTERSYLQVARRRIQDALAGKARYRPHDKPIYDHTRSPLAKSPGV